MGLDPALKLELFKWALGLLSLSLAGLAAVFWYFVRQVLKDIRDTKAAAASAVDEEKVRSIVEKRVAPQFDRIEKDISSVKEDVQKMSSGLLESINNLDQKISALMMHFIGKK